MIVASSALGETPGDKLGPLAGPGPDVGNYLFTTIAGSPGIAGHVDGPGSSARFDQPRGLAVDAEGNVYVADYSHTVRKVARDGTVTTLAGQPDEIGSADGVGADARFWAPQGVAVDAVGRVFVADGFNATIRQVTPDGRVTTIAGRPGERGYRDGPGKDALFEFPVAIALDCDGNLYVTDSRGAGPAAVRRISPDGNVSTLATLLYPTGAGGLGYNASGLAVDAAGKILVAETPSGRIQQVSSEGVVTTFAGGFAAPYAVATDADARVYVANWATSSIAILNPNGTELRSIGRRGAGDGKSGEVGFNQLTSLAVDRAGNIYVADTGNHTIRKGVLVNPDRMVSSRLTNFSVRSVVVPGQTLIAGIGARGGARPILVRAVGPGLFPFTGPAVALSRNPRLELWNPQTMLLGVNSDWTTAPDRVSLSSAFARSGAFPLPEIGGDAAIVHDLEGSVTAHVNVGMAGVVLLEAYDANDAAPGRLVNLSVRYMVGRDDAVLTAGFVLAGTEARTLLIRGVGSASAVGIPDGLRDPRIEVFDRAGRRIAENDDWSASLAAVAADVGAFALTPQSKDAAVLLTIVPGAYTITLSANDGSSGIGLLEVYEVQ